MTKEQQSIHERIMGARRATGDGRDFVQDTGPTAAKKVWLRIVLFSVATVSVLGAACLAVWQFPVFAEGAEQPGKLQPTLQVSPGAAPFTAKDPIAAQVSIQDSDPFTAKATAAGVKSCAATYGALGKVLTDGTQFMVQNQMGANDPDRHALHGLVGMTFHNSKDVGYSGPAAGIVFAAPVQQGCQGTMVRVVPLERSCQDVVSFLPKGSEPEQPLEGLPVFSLGGGGQAMLLPSRQGCVVLSIARAG